MSKGRLEAFSDGVLAIIITIMVLELHVPAGDGLSALRPLAPVFLSYVLSFAYVGIYWNNHHHMLQATRQVDGRALWANLHLLFWLSLVPFTTAWMGQSDFAAAPTATYGLVLLMASIAYYALSRSLIALHGGDSPLATAIGGDSKGRLSVGLYAVALPVAFVGAWAAMAVYVLVAIIWVVPDRRIARALAA
ncbi:MAG: hypothetical protein C0506_07380 [Anaerolinea sp.]|nr:hypothetical protein [Anaerolinea sp.]